MARSPSGYARARGVETRSKAVQARVQKQWLLGLGLQRATRSSSKYRIDVIGPGVTPNLAALVDDPGAWSPEDPAKVAYERQMKARQLELSRGDKFCPTQT